MSPWRQPVRRLGIAMVVLWLFTAVGFGWGLSIVNDKADKNDVTAERARAQQSDCEARVEARSALRDTITQAFTPVTLRTDYPLSQEQLAVLGARRDALLKRVPELVCKTQAGIPIPVPVTAAGGTGG